MKKTLILISVILSLLVCSVSAEEIATSFEVVPTVNNEEVSVSVKYTDEGGMCGGSFNFVFDQTKLELLDAIEGEAVKDTPHFINKEYRENALRMNWASTMPLPSEGELIVVKLKLKGGAFDKDSIFIENLKIADGSGKKLLWKCEVIYDGAEKAEPETAPAPEKDYSSNAPSAPVYPEKEQKENENQNKIENAVEDEIKEEATGSKFSFVDVKENDWYYEAVKFAFEKGITSGVSEISYAPNAKVTRGQFITMLCRAYGIKEMTGDNFADCGNTWYTGYLAAAKQLGISNGVGDNKFAPEKQISREEMVTLIYNYLKSAGKANTEVSETSFADDAAISSWAKKGVAFASANGYVKGKGNNVFDPDGHATRAELAQIFFNMFK